MISLSLNIGEMGNSLIPYNVQTQLINFKLAFYV